MSLRRKLIYGVTALVVAALLLLPLTGWVARLQLMPWRYAAVASHFTANHAQAMTERKAITAFVRTVPDDFSLQFGYAMSGYDSHEQLECLDAVDRRFPHHPEVLAAILRTTMRDPIKLRRAEEGLLSPQQGGRPGASEPVPPPDAATWARFDAVAAEGERLDPRNGYFPAMRAAGDYAARRDTEANAAWVRAADKPVWREYMQDELNAEQRLLEARSGGRTGFLPRLLVRFSLMYPQYGALRASARMATVGAFQAEQRGGVEDGLALRRATRRIGSAMAADDEGYTSNLVGTRVTRTAAWRPGAVPALFKVCGHLSPSQSAVVAGAYRAYLTSVGHADEAAAWEAARDKNAALNAVSRAGFRKSYLGDGDKLLCAFLLWCGDSLLLAGVWFALLFAGLFAAVYRFSPRLRNGEPLQASARCGVFLGLALACGGGIAAGYCLDASVGVIATDLLVLPALLFGARAFLARPRAPEAGHAVGVAGMTLVFIAAVIGVSVLAGTLIHAPLSLTQALQGVATSDEGVTSQASPGLSATLPAAAAAFMFCVPALMLAAFAVLSRVLRIPVAAGVTRGTRAFGIPLACVLTLCWAACVVATARFERAAARQLDRVDQVGEEQTYAELAAKPSLQEGN